MSPGEVDADERDERPVAVAILPMTARRAGPRKRRGRTSCRSHSSRRCEESLAGVKQHWQVYKSMTWHGVYEHWHGMALALS